MATVPEQETRDQITAFAGQTNFTYSFLILDEVDITVYQTLAGQTPNPVADLLTLNNDYTVTGVGNDNGGSVILVVAAAVNDVITEERDTVIQRLTDFSVAGQFTASAVNLEFDRDVMIAQEIETQLLQRGLTYQATDELGANRQNNILPILPLNTATQISIWSRAAGGALVALQINSADDVNTLRSELASQVSGGDGALLVGYFDSVGGGKTVKSKLDQINTLLTDYLANSTHADCGANLIGYNPASNATTVRDELDVLGNTRCVPLNAILNGTLYQVTLPTNIFPFTSYNEDSIFKIKFDLTNPGAVTLDINTIGAKDLNDAAGSPLAAGYFEANTSALVYFDATADEFRILSLTKHTSVEGSVKAWGRSSLGVGDTYNCSVVESPAGTFTVSLSVTMSSSIYPVVAQIDGFIDVLVSGRTPTSFQIEVEGGAGGGAISFAVYGNLA